MKKKIMAVITTMLLSAELISLSVVSQAADSAPQMEYLDRGTVAVKVTDGVYLSWRLLGTENYDTAFDVYRGTTKIATVSDSTNYTDTNGNTRNKYTVVPKGESRVDGKEVKVWSNQYISIPLSLPDDDISLDGEQYEYTANDAECADLDGDGEYEIILKWDPTNSFDSGKDARHTGNVYIDAYKLDGTRLWRMDLGVNISAGAHFTQIAAYDFDLDGKAEIAFKTAPGTKDGQGNYVSDASSIEAIKNTDNAADYRHTEGGTNDTGGRVLSGDEYYTVFQGDTGAALDTVYYPHPRGTIIEWGDDWGNRSERYLTAVAYLDGVRPSMIAWRGYYAKTTATAYNLVNKKLVQVADFDSSVTGYEKYGGQGNHNLAVGDVDGDGKDEIICGSLALDDDLTPLWCSYRGHGDALHLADYDPSHSGMEYFSVHESEPYGMTLYDAATGEELFHLDAGSDTGRGMMANVGYTDGYFELWGAGSYASYGGDTVIRSNYRPDSTNFRVFWDGDLYDDLLDGTGSYASPIKISNKTGRIMTLPEGITNNSTKNNVCLSADLFGDWREELVVRSYDSNSLFIYTTTIPTTNKLYTLMHDRAYRMQVASQNSAYNQPPHISYYVSDDNNDYDRRKYSSYVKTVHNGEENVRTANLPDEKPPVKASSKPTPTAAPTPTSKPSPTPETTATPEPTPEIKQFVIEDGVLIEYNGTDKNLRIPESYEGQEITAIGAYAFSGNENLTRVYIGSNITEIQEGAFSYCAALTYVKLPEGLTEIADDMFNGCECLEKIDWPAVIYRIGSGAFGGCKLLDYIPTEYANEIGRMAFYGCEGLEQLVLSKDIDYANRICWECKGLKRVLVYGMTTDISNAIYDWSNISIYGYTGSEAQNFADIADIPFYDLDTKKRVITEWVADEDGLLVRYNGEETSVTVPSVINGVTVTAISDGVFSGLTAITVPSSVQTIYDDAFEQCPDIVIYGQTGSVAEVYAREHNIPFYVLDKGFDFTMTVSDGRLYIENNAGREETSTLYKARFENGLLKGIETENISISPEGTDTGIAVEAGDTFYLWSIDFVPLADKLEIN